MKKTLFILALLAGFSSAAQAQRNVSLGLKAGGSYSSFTGAQSDGYESIYGFHGGVFANIGLTKLFAFQPERVVRRLELRWEVRAFLSPSTRAVPGGPGDTDGGV